MATGNAALLPSLDLATVNDEDNVSGGRGPDRYNEEDTLVRGRAPCGRRRWWQRQLLQLSAVRLRMRL